MKNQTELSLLKVVAYGRLHSGYPSFEVKRNLPYRSASTDELVHALVIADRPINVSTTALRMMVRRCNAY